MVVLLRAPGCSKRFISHVLIQDHDMFLVKGKSPRIHSRIYRLKAEEDRCYVD